ncbi:MlaD family protein [Mycolicibacterium sp. XJ662]
MSAEAETRRLTIIGVVVTLCFAVVCVLVVTNPFARQTNQISVVMDMPFVGQGVATNTPLMMHGVTVGEVTAVKSLPSGTVRVNADLEAALAADLTDTMNVDFRPANYFGVTGINLIPGEAGEPLRSGAFITTTPQGNFTLQALLTRMGSITGSVITPQLVDVVNRATQYTDGLNPLIESMLIAAESVDKVQTVSTERLLRNATGISVAFPAFTDAVTAAGYGWNQGSSAITFKVSGEEALPGQEQVAVIGGAVSEEYWRERAIPTLEVVANSLFGAVGKLESSHATNLLPAVKLTQSLTDTVPALLTPVGVNETLVELRTRFEKLYAGSSEQRALQVHIVLDQIPGVQAPINAMGGP